MLYRHVLRPLARIDNHKVHYIVDTVDRDRTPRTYSWIDGEIEFSSIPEHAEDGDEIVLFPLIPLTLFLGATQPRPALIFSTTPSQLEVRAT